MKTVQPLLEVIACSAVDATAAERGGAHRLEVISRFDVGGLTPPLALVREILDLVSIPVRVMLRENAGYRIAGAEERKRLVDAARAFAALPIDGLVLGFLRAGKNGETDEMTDEMADEIAGERAGEIADEIDEEALAEMLDAAPNLSATFHHAFEDVRDQERTIAVLKRYPQVDRILTSGGQGSLDERIGRMAVNAQLAAPEIRLLAGGGVTAETIAPIRARTPVREFHVGRAARAGGDINAPVDSARVRSLVDLLNASR